MIAEPLTCAICGKPIARDEAAVRTDSGVAHTRCAERQRRADRS